MNTKNKKSFYRGPGTGGGAGNSSGGGATDEELDRIIEEAEKQGGF